MEEERIGVQGVDVGELLQFHQMLKLLAVGISRVEDDQVLTGFSVAVVKGQLTGDPLWHWEKGLVSRVPSLCF